MAARGKPLAFSVRQQIKERRPETPIRKVASTLRVSPNTVRKYESKFDTKP